jgi:hypothetical protein
LLLLLTNSKERIPSLKVIVSQLVNKNPPFYGTRRFIAVVTTARYWSLSWDRWIQFTPSKPISLRSILMLSSHLRLGLPSFPSLLVSGRNCLYISHLSHACYMTRPFYPPEFDDSPNNESKVKNVVTWDCIQSGHLRTAHEKSWPLVWTLYTVAEFQIWGWVTSHIVCLFVCFSVASFFLQQIMTDIKFYWRL